MKRIDRETVQRILDTADIVEVVSDFVNLKKRGANYIGLCPFHNERTPSFSVSRAKGICKCFSCGKGGSPVNFVMEHEQMSFNEALRYLAKKYHIEIKEYEETDAERQRSSDRESMLAVNDFALKHFSHNLKDTADGRDIGLAYFRERGINDLMIERFKLGYSLDVSADLYKAAISKGYEEKYLLDTGLCARSESGNRVYDKFRGRVIYPLFSISGRVVAFGARTLRSDKSVAKYLNSPQSLVYNKSREVYGLYQAKPAIVRKGKCILVEGYMDVISMCQIGIENVVASCGTSLTTGQISQIHRFTENVTLIYDSDAAGVKASLKGIDLLLAEGMNIKVLQFPEGEDPDSFAQTHSAQQVEDYIAEHETDFIRFKTAILLKDANNDPMARAAVINDILRSIAVVPDIIMRAEYIKECSRMLEIAENTLMLQLTKLMGDNAQKVANQQQRTYADPVQVPPEQGAAGSVQTVVTTRPVEQSQIATAAQKPVNKRIRKYEEELMKFVVKYGMAQLQAAEGEEGISVIDFISGQLADDDIKISDPVLARLLDEAMRLQVETWPADIERYKATALDHFNKSINEGREKIRVEAADLAEIESRDRALCEECSAKYNQLIDDFAAKYIESSLLSCPDDQVRAVATELAFDRYTLSKVHTRYAHIETERERLCELVPRAVLELKLCILNENINELHDEIVRRCNEPAVIDLLQEQKRLYEIRSEFSKHLGDRIVTPPNK